MMRRFWRWITNADAVAGLLFALDAMTEISLAARLRVRCLEARLEFQRETSQRYRRERDEARRELAVERGGGIDSPNWGRMNGEQF